MKLSKLASAAIILFSVALATQTTTYAENQNRTADRLKEVTRYGAKRFVKSRSIAINCKRKPLALKKAIEKKAFAAETVRFIIFGECLGPIRVDRTNIEIVNNKKATGSILVKEFEDEESAISVEAGTAKLKGFDIKVPAGLKAVLATSNAFVTLDNITTNAQHPDSPDAIFRQYQARGNSTFHVKNISNVIFSIHGSSYAEFQEGNTGISMEIADTSTALSNDANTFNAVEVSGNGYFRADKKSRVGKLMIWSKAAAVAVDNTIIDEIMMGGQTLFAAYQGSTVNGPYGIWGNVVFELEHSTANNWVKVNKPHAILSGNNATVNGKTYPGWSWSGQDGTEAQ